MKLGIVILNYRTPDLTLDCLRSLIAERDAMQTAGGLRVVVVDNHSDDGSAQAIAKTIEAESIGDWVELLPLDENLGFAGGNNPGVDRLIDCQYVLLLNSDTVVHPGCLAHCVAVMDRDDTIGVMSGLVLNADGTPQNVTRTFPNPLRSTVESLGLPWKLPRLFGWADTDDLTWDRMTTTRDVDWVGGAFMLICRTVIDKIACLDDDFFFYGEDIEFCHRVWRNGWRVHYAPGPPTTHLGGASSDPDQLPALHRSKLQWRARYLVQRKCYGWLAMIWLRAVDLAVWSARLVWRFVTGKRDVRFQLARQNVNILRGRLFSP